MNGTRITFSNENGEFSVFLEKTEMNLEDVFELMVKGVLLAAGYQESSISEYLGEDK